ncbi:MAG: polyprenyl synthetase family protein, partial [Mariprofundaceae bacterium]|nr:polyprenyl synthetase family protein [Mariprofundaceae bacterium]
MNQATELCRDDLRKVDACIRRELDSDVLMIPAIGNYIVDSGGKRLRPLLVLLCGAALGGCSEQHIKFAATIEFIHTATLLHDDVVD